ncbi:hypothetical protein PV350_01955 [Streptomyces sp. PA03-6a]|nr:hypothetical protein [Streptomyces sp. PA03-6a]
MGGLSFAGLSDGAEPIDVTLIAVFVTAVVFRRDIRRVFGLAGLVTGGP